MTTITGTDPITTLTSLMTTITGTDPITTLILTITLSTATPTQRLGIPGPN